MDGGSDRPQWSLTKNGSFTVESFYQELFKHDGNGMRFLGRQIWKAKVRPCVLFFCMGDK